MDEVINREKYINAKVLGICDDEQLAENYLGKKLHQYTKRTELL